MHEIGDRVTFPCGTYPNCTLRKPVKGVIDDIDYERVDNMGCWVTYTVLVGGRQSVDIVEWKSYLDKGE